MKKIYLLFGLIGISISSVLAQDTLKHYDVFSSGGVNTPFETNVFPDPWGFTYGHGALGINEMAEKFYLPTEKNVVGVVVLLGEFFTGANSSDNATIGIYGLADNGGPKNSSLMSQNVAMTSLNLGINNPTIVTLNTPYTIKDSFFVSFGYPKYEFNRSSPNFVNPNDTLALYVTQNRSEDPDSNIWYRNAVRYGGDQWENPQSIVLGDRINFCIAPIIAPKGGDTSSINELTISSDIKVNHVYPNPVNDHVNIAMTVDKNTQARISIFDMAGRSLSTANYDLTPGEHQLRLDIDANTQAQQLVALIQTDQGMVSLLLHKQ